jgi:phage gpG-like protein
VAGEDVAIRVDGLSGLRKGLRQLDPDANKELTQALKAAADKVAVTAGALAPRRSGELAHSIRPQVSGTRASIVSSLPYAAVVHWGGTIAPRGARITFKRTGFITRAVEDHRDELLQDVAAGIDHALQRVADQARI